MGLVGMEDREVVSMNGDGYGGYKGSRFCKGLMGSCMAKQKVREMMASDESFIFKFPVICINFSKTIVVELTHEA